VEKTVSLGGDVILTMQLLDLLRKTRKIFKN